MLTMSSSPKVAPPAVAPAVNETNIGAPGTTIPPDPPLAVEEPPGARQLRS